MKTPIGRQYIKNNLQSLSKQQYESIKEKKKESKW